MHWHGSECLKRALVSLFMQYYSTFQTFMFNLIVLDVLHTPVLLSLHSTSASASLRLLSEDHKPRFSPIFFSESFAHH